MAFLLVLGGLRAVQAQPATSTAKTAVDPARAQVQWSERELAYLQSRGPIRMCVAPDWMPIEGIDRDGGYTGMAADFIRLMIRRGGLNVQLVRTRTWDESFALGQRRQCDIFSLLMDSPSRRSFLDFTTPYLEIPGVIATSVNVPFVANLEQVRGKRLGHMRGFAGIELLRQSHPGIQLIPVDSYEEGLTKVQDGELYGFIGNMMSVGRALQENKIYDVKIAGRIGHDNLMSVATRNDQPVLRDVFQKLVDTITPAERQDIMNRWIAVRFEEGFDYRRFWQIFGVFALVGVVTLFWATKLRRLNAELRAANSRLAETSRRDGLTGLYNRMHFDEIVVPTLHLCARNALTMTLAIIDLDRFKDINDTYGHPFGDACLRHVAAVLRKSFRRDSDTAVRYGGEELIVISVGGTPPEMIERLEAFRREIEQSLVALDSRQSRLTLSIGVWSAIPDVHDDPMQLLKLADAALYRAKREGRNRLAVAGDAVSQVSSQGA
ncbi:MAG: diguanylate cyclase [Acidobacteria bacterium]|nr:diguanylate cyclase [Acidobacteriota bacterium]MBV9475956.1 diguanylate cyclase [Acidobacteriota bacterium]